MRKWIVVVLLLCGASVASFARAQFRIATDAGMDFSDQPSLADVRSSIDDPTSIFYGFHSEVITGGAIGFGLRTMVRFASLEAPGTWAMLYDWWIDWNGELFVSLHPFKGGALVDPFLEVGYGVVGRAGLTPTVSGTWVEDELGLWSYRWNEDVHDAVTNLSFSPFVAGGLALDLDSFLLGLRIGFRPFVHPVPGTQIANYPLKSFQVSLFTGVAIGGHGR